MRTRRPLARYVPAAAAVTLLAAACSGGSGTASGHLEQTTIIVDAFESTDTAGLFIAEQEGLFAAQGLNVKLNLVSQVQGQIDDLVRGKADIASGDYSDFIENETGGDPDLPGHPIPNLRIIAESSFLQPNAVDIIIPRGSKTDSIAALKGGSLSIPAPATTAQLLVDALLVEHGIPLDDVRYPDVLFPAIGTEFAKHTIDAAMAAEPFVTLLEEQTGVNELADLDQGSTTNFPIVGLATTASWAQQNPNTLAAFLRAYDEGQLIASTSRPAVSKALEKFLGLPPRVATLVALPAYPRGVDPIRLQRTVDALLRFGILSQRFKNFNVRSMIDTG
jgi:NitT/TauT family transport system substrate-binding protein